MVLLTFHFGRLQLGGRSVELCLKVQAGGALLLQALLQLLPLLVQRLLALLRILAPGFAATNQLQGSEISRSVKWTRKTRLSRLSRDYKERPGSRNPSYWTVRSVSNIATQAFWQRIRLKFRNQLTGKFRLNPRWGWSGFEEPGPGSSKPY